MATAPLEFGAVAPRLAANGYSPVPIRRGSKRPPMAKWPGFRLDDETVKKYKHFATGLLTGALVGIDVDVLHEAAAKELHHLARSKLGNGPVRIGRPPKFLAMYRAAAPFRKRQTRAFLIDGHTTRLEVLADGQQFVAYAIHPETQEPYHWPDKDPLTIPFADLPEVTEERIATFLAEAEAVLARYGPPQTPDRLAKGAPTPHFPPRDDDPARRAYVEAALANEVKRVGTAAVGSRNNALNIAALKLGKLVAGGWLDCSRVERSLEDAAQADGLASDDGLESVRATIRSGLEAGMREPRDPPERGRYTDNGNGRGNGGFLAPQPKMASPPESRRPAPLAEEAFHGIAGALVRAIEPHTEADPAGILIQLLVAAGNAIGRGSHCYIEATRHHANLFSVLVGRTSKARKGTSLGWARRVTLAADPGWESCMLSGLASGEGLIHAVRDARFGTDKRGEEQTIEDEGVADKRLFVAEEEFARVLRVSARPGNTLSSVIRDAWDAKRILSAASKNSPSRATGAHVSVIGHVTSGELLELITETDATNGIGNRFLWAFVERSKLLPFGGDVPELGGLTTRLAAILDEAKAEHCLAFDEDAADVWAEVYPELSKERDGLLGAMLARGEAQVIRLAMLYAVLDGERSIRMAHLLAALAVWNYCEASARHVFGEDLDNTTADRILGATAL